VLLGLRKLIAPRAALDTFTIMTDKLPPNLLALFAPRPALRYLPPSDHAPELRKTSNIAGVGQYLQELKEYDDDYEPTESWLQRKDREKLERKQAVERAMTEGIKTCKLQRRAGLVDLVLTTADRPQEDPNARGDAYKTLFVSRLSYDTEVKDLEREFGRFGPIERVGCNSHGSSSSILTGNRFVLSRIPVPKLRISPRRREVEDTRSWYTSERKT
jgi:U1 small nuclear ribonucleoprotein 70kDa